MGRLGFLYDMNSCIGCGGCQTACKEVNRLGPAQFMRRVELRNTAGDIGTERAWFYSAACNHCEKPACAEICPTGAMYQSADGTVQHDDRLCIGCGRCAAACPYGAVLIDPVTGYSRKCDSCIDRRARGQEPACAANCRVKAIRFGDLDELSAVPGSRKPLLPWLPAPSLTEPSLRILGGPEPDCIREIPGLSEANGSVPREAEVRGPVPGKNASHRLPASGATGRIPEEGGRSLPLRFLVLGGGPAAVTAVRTLRKEAPEAEITMVSKEDLPFSRPMLSKGSFQQFHAFRYRIIEPEWFRENRVTFLKTAAEKINPERHTVSFSGGQLLPYDRLIYALGSEAGVPPIPGLSACRYHTVRHAEDLAGIRGDLLTAEDALVIGGGFIGLELASALHRSGLSVTVLEGTGKIMGPAADLYTSGILKQKLEEQGIRIVLNAAVTGVSESGRRTVVTTKKSGIFRTDLLLLSTGVRAVLGPAQGTGMEIGKSIRVSERMETGVPDIYACGNCVNVNGKPSTVWISAVRQGETAARNAAGGNAVYEERPESMIVEAAGTALFSAGDPGVGKTQEDGYETLSARWSVPDDRMLVNSMRYGKETFGSCVFRKGRLVGACLLGNLSDILLFRDLVEAAQEKDAVLSMLKKRGMPEWKQA